MSTIRWVHRKGQNSEKRVISLNEIKERYLNDVTNARKDKRNEKSCCDGINTGTGKKKEKKKLITFYEKKAEKTFNQQKGLSEKYVSNYVGEKKKYCCSGENGQTKNGCSECSGQVDPLGGQHGMFGQPSDVKKGGMARPMEERSNLCPHHHDQQQVNINLDVSIEWNKQKGKFEKVNSHIGDMRTYFRHKKMWHPIQVSISDKYSGENGYSSESPIGYEKGRSGKGDVPYPWEGQKYEQPSHYGNPTDGHYHERSGGNKHPQGELPNPVDRNKHINRFEEECTTYAGMRPAPYVPLDKSHAGHAWDHYHNYADPENSHQLRYDSGGKLHPVRKVERHEVKTCEGGAQERAHMYVKQAHLPVHDLQKCAKSNPLEDPVKEQTHKERQKYSRPMDEERICRGDEERAGFFQGGGKRTDMHSADRSDFNKRGWMMGPDKPIRGDNKPPPHDYHKTAAYLVSSEEVVLRGEKQQKEYEQDKKKKKIIFSIHTINNILKKKIFNYLTSWRKYSIVRVPRSVYKKYSKIVPSGENYQGNKNQGSHSAVSGHTIQNAFPRKADMPLWCFNKMPNEGKSCERVILRSTGEELQQDGNKEGSPLKKKKKKKTKKENENTKEGSIAETIQKGEVVHHNELGVPPFAKKKSRENFKMYKQLSHKKVVLSNTLIHSFIDVDIHDQRKKKKYLKFFSILLCLFLRRHMHRQLSVFFSVIGSFQRRQEEKRSIRKFINSRVYALSILEGVLKRTENKKALRQMALLKKEKRDDKEDKQTHHYSDHPIRSNRKDERNVVNSAPHHVQPLPQKNTPYDERVGECMAEDKPKLTSTKSHEKPCFGKPKIFRTDDFAVFFKKKILKEKDDILQKCLLRSKSDAVLDFLKMKGMENFSKKATCSSAVLNFPDGAVYYNDDMRSSTLLDRFFTATYSPHLPSVSTSKEKGDKIHLSFYDNVTADDTSTLIRSSLNFQQCHRKRETYMHFNRECFETGGVNNCVGSTSHNMTRGKERLTTKIGDALDVKMGSISEVMNKLGCLIGDSTFLTGVIPGGAGDHMDDSSEEDVHDKRCRMFFKQFKKQLTMKCKGAAPEEEDCTDDRHAGGNHLGQADEEQNGLSLSDLNSTVGVSKGGEKYTHGGWMQK
ncbi:hypothetical protein AK88_01757 [Plasmodium fragile]|uniref:Uncharacterized protein n=1 Tax=Plasmodium fragile TaxID=5857 RepID=A0A0D9QPH4_PLAFR|nr:uncharacterized protein AK88_01757 [Plasmodium fragile]KJP88677.1 hypothetical protein AK88_01757 [Plasmodium fragile]